MRKDEAYNHIERLLSEGASITVEGSPHGVEVNIGKTWVQRPGLETALIAAAEKAARNGHGKVECWPMLSMRRWASDRGLQLRRPSEPSRE